MINNETILALSPHTDDAELACGATLSKFIEEGKDVYMLVFSAPSKKLSEECTQSFRILNKHEPDNLTILDYERRLFPEHRQEILQTLYDLNKTLKPNLILTPCTRDHHQDHQTVTQEALRIFKTTTILGYELPWNIWEFMENGYSKIERSHLNTKLDSLEQYESQKHRHYFSPEYIKSLALIRGGQVGVKYAEAFEVIRVIL